jgi:hypothetical protein
MDLTPCASRRALLIGAFVVMAVPAGAPAQSRFVCWPIAPGETAWSLAQRLTGSANDAYSDRFQIRDPMRTAFVPKSQYHRLSADWDVCVAGDAVRPTADEVRPIAVEAVRSAAIVSPAPQRAPRHVLDAHDLDLALRVGLTVSLLLFASTVVMRFVPPAPVPPHLQRAGEAFISAFVSPLIDPGADAPPIVTRLRFVRHRDQLEIYLAPNGGRRYPNLQDHKKNVEYDVARVLQLLQPRVVISSPLRAEGKWVVVPIRLAPRAQAKRS